MHGTDSIPSLIAALARPCPAMIVPSSSMRMGFVNPYSLMDAQIWATCSSECVRELFAYGMSSDGFLSTISIDVSPFRITTPL